MNYQQKREVDFELKNLVYCLETSFNPISYLFFPITHRLGITCTFKSKISL